MLWKPLARIIWIISRTSERVNSNAHYGLYILHYIMYIVYYIVNIRYILIIVHYIVNTAYCIVHNTQWKTLYSDSAFNIEYFFEYWISQSRFPIFSNMTLTPSHVIACVTFPEIINNNQSVIMTIIPTMFSARSARNPWR